MQYRTRLFSFFLGGTILGLVLSYATIPALIPVSLVVAIILLMGSVLLPLRSHLSAQPSYEELAQALFADIRQDVDAMRQFMEDIKEWQLRQQLNLICEDITTLLDKVTEKTPESRLTAGKFIRGYLDFINNDILPQYIEMQNTPRYYDSQDKKMANGREAIRTFGTFLHNRIVELELRDEMRYAVAIEMLKALNNYKNGDAANS